MQIDSLKVVFTYAIATLLIGGGLAFLFFVRNDDPNAGQSATLVPLIAGFIGAAVQFVFNRETQTSTARATERAVAAGSSTTAAATAAAGPTNGKS
jgi:hypothetical protein